jgi:hypothetical protein
MTWQLRTKRRLGKTALFAASYFASVTRCYWSDETKDHLTGRAYSMQYTDKIFAENCTEKKSVNEECYWMGV